jgi:peptidoglycan/xylan/chitin deacetylase (PgdA/CDA1 family)
MFLILGFASALGVIAAASATAPVPARRVALVFDDGPDPVQGRKLQALLAGEGVRVTFAHVGRNVRQHAEITQAAFAAGHEIINHSDTHAGIDKLDTTGVEAEVVGGRQAITDVIGTAPRWYWPPYLAVDPRLIESVKRAQQAFFMPHRLVDSRDWDRAISAEEILRRATTDVQDGSVILFHEWREETLAQLPAILAELRRQGCRFLTFSQLADDLHNGAPPASPADDVLRARFGGMKEP